MNFHLRIFWTLVVLAVGAVTLAAAALAVSIFAGFLEGF